MILLSPKETARREAGIAMRDRLSVAARNYAGQADRIQDTSDLPFFFTAYGIERPLRKWLERLCVTTLAHGHDLRTALREANVSLAGHHVEDDVIEACLIRGWLKPVAFTQRGLLFNTVNMGANAAHWSCWTFEPDGEFGEWLEGGPLPAIGCPLRQAEYDGQTVGLIFRSRELAIWQSGLDEIVLWEVGEHARRNPKDECGILRGELLDEVCCYSGYEAATLVDVTQSVDRLKQRSLAREGQALRQPKNRTESLPLFEEAAE